jgi:hypothetical protein
MEPAPRVLPISSNEFTRQRGPAWDSVKDECDMINGPETGTNMKFFQPTLECGLAIKSICNEYTQQVDLSSIILNSF